MERRRLRVGPARVGGFYVWRRERSGVDDIGTATPPRGSYYSTDPEDRPRYRPWSLLDDLFVPEYSEVGIGTGLLLHKINGRISSIRPFQKVWVLKQVMPK